MNPEIELLVFKAYCGELSGSERDMLTRWVVASPAHARQVVEYSADAYSIEIALQSRQATKATSANKMVNVEFGTQESALGNSMLTTFHGAVAALLVFTLLGVALCLGWIQRVQDRENHEHAELPVTASERASGELTETLVSYVQVLESTDLEWNRYTNHPGDSETIVIPVSGYVYHEFRGDGFILLEGPTTYQLEDDDTIRLIEGRLVAKAVSGEPITILVDGARIATEGAEFGVQNVDDNVASSVVFEGSIEVTQDLSKGQSPVTSVRAGQSVLLGPHGEKVDQLARATQADSSEYLRLIDSVKLRPSYMSNSVEFITDTPQSLLTGDLADGRHARLFCERAGVSVKADDVHIVRNRLTDLGDVPADILLDSYLLHFDPQIEGIKAGSKTSGMIKFDRPIYAVLGSASAIRSTDEFFGSTNTAYPRTSRPVNGAKDTGQWGIECRDDCMKLDSDGRTLLFRVKASQELDQVRILVEARKPTQLSE